KQFAAVVTVGGVAGDQEKQDRGKKLHQAHKAKIERTMRNFIELPADSDGLHFRGEDREKTGGLKTDESRGRKRDTSRGGLRRRRERHEPLLCHRRREIEKLRMEARTGAHDWAVRDGKTAPGCGPRTPAHKIDLLLVMEIDSCHPSRNA